MTTNDYTSTHIVYRIFNIENGKSYVGQARDFKTRISEHFNLLAKNQHHSKALQRAYNYDGKGWFKAELLEENIPMTEINIREVFWIAHFNSYVDGYNMNRGGSSTREGKAHKPPRITITKAAKPITLEKPAAITRKTPRTRLKNVMDNEVKDDNPVRLVLPSLWDE